MKQNWLPEILRYKKNKICNTVLLDTQALENQNCKHNFDFPMCGMSSNTIA